MRFSSLRSATVKRSNLCIKFLTSKFIYDPCITRANFLYKLAQTVINGTFFSVNLFVPHRLTNPTVKTIIKNGQNIFLSFIITIKGKINFECDN